MNYKFFRKIFFANWESFLIENFDKEKEKIIKELIQRILFGIVISEDKEFLINSLKENIVSELKDIFDIEVEKGKILIRDDEIPELKKINVEKEVIKDTFAHDIIVGTTAVVGAIGLGMLMKKLTGKTGGVIGALIGGFIGSAAGSAIGDDFVITDYFKKEKLDESSIKQELEKLLERELDRIITEKKENIIDNLKRELNNNEHEKPIS